MARLAEADQTQIRTIFNTLDDMIAVADTLEFSGDWESGAINIGSVCLRTASGDLSTDVGLEPEGSMLDKHFTDWLSTVVLDNFVEGMSLRRTAAGFIIARSTLQALDTGNMYHYDTSVVAANDDPGSHLFTHEEGQLTVSPDGRVLSSTHSRDSRSEPTGTLPRQLRDGPFNNGLFISVQTIQNATQTIVIP